MVELRVHGPLTQAETERQLVCEALEAIARDEGETWERRWKARRALMRENSSGGRAAIAVAQANSQVLGNRRGGNFMQTTIEYKGDSSGR